MSQGETTARRLEESEALPLAGRTILYHFCGASDMQGGVQQSTNTLADYMAGQQGIHTELSVGSGADEHLTAEVFAAFPPAHIHVLDSQRRTITANGSQNELNRLLRPKAARALLKNINPDLVHVMAPWQPQTGGMVLRQVQREGLPTLATYHIDSDERRTNTAVQAAGLIDRRIIHRLQTIIAVSPVAERHLKRYYGYSGKVHVIPNPIDVTAFETARPFEAHEPFEEFASAEHPTIVFVGRPDERKGLDTLLQATALIATSGSADPELIVCGDGPNLPDFKAYARHCGIEQRTHFVGRVSNGDKARWLATANLAIFPARSGESQGLVLLEAMAAGAGAVLGGANDGYRSVLEELEGSELALFDPNSPRELADRINYLLRNESITSQLHAEQQELVRTKYDVGSIGRRVAALYRSLLY